MDASETKSDLRSAARRRVLELGDDLRRALDARIVGRILDLEDYLAAEQVLAYAALTDEVALDALFVACEGDGKALFLPAVAGEQITFRRWRIGDSLERNELGVGEPSNGAVPGEGRTLVVVPGRAFDRRGARLGRGGGFYDRLMDAPRAGWSFVGVCYACQLADAVPEEPHDRRVGLVVCEQGALSPAAGSD